MRSLSQNEEHIIDLALQQVDIHFLKEELFDHLCTDVEQKLAQGQGFEIALRESISSFGKNGLLKTEQDTIYLINQKKRLMKVISFSFLILLLLVVFSNLEGQKLPSIKPIDANISSTFGSKLHPIHKVKKMHKGIDFQANIGTPVIATADGVILLAGVHKKYGKRIQIKHDKGISTLYAHLSKIKVKKGQKIKQGELIGAVGSTGLSTAPHLHYEVRKNNKAVNPKQYLKP